MWTKKFWSDAIERVLFTAAQAALGVLVATGLAGFAVSAGWVIVGTAAAAALLKAIIAGYTGPDDISPASFAK